MAGKAASKAAGGPGNAGASAAPADEVFDREAAGLSYEEALERLETIIEEVEHGEIGLERSLEAYRRGRSLLRRCQTILDQAEQEIRRLSLADAEREAGGEGEARTR